MRLKSISLLLIALFLVFWVVSSESDANNLLKGKASLRKQALLHPRLLLHTSTSSHVLLHKRLQKSNAIPGDDQIPEVMGLDRATINGPQGHEKVTNPGPNILLVVLVPLLVILFIVLVCITIFTIYRRRKHRERERAFKIPVYLSKKRGISLPKMYMYLLSETVVLS
ncbi:hypothetical protein MRB53_002778 [Persea americana]|uniref:Uncharacterized protein n=1 Tax=Persea americana TaxID=3435 RepID=A0ACC2MVS3_PERAE|nr:hypothetical protein MRB53_002778 [Persea americana]